MFYFIAWHESVQSAFDIFVLCVTKGQCIDTYITKEGSPYAERISDVILFSSMTTVQQIITAATKDIRKQYLWGTFGKQHQSSKPCIDLTDHIQELRDVSYQIDLTSIDSRLHALLCDELSELQIPWRDVLLSIQQSPSFSHCITENSISSIYIIYCSDEDMFIDLELDQHSKVVEARVLSRDKIIMHGNDSNPTEMFQVRSVTEEFTNFLLQWIWSDTQVEF